MLSRLRLPTLRSPGQGLPLTLMKWLWNMSVSMLLLSSLRREARTLTRFLVNGRLRLPMLRLRAAQDEAIEQLDIVKRENKNLADEIKDLLDQ